MEKMTEDELKAKIEALGLPKGDERIKSIVCSLIGHSNIIETCFGYINCARCGDQIGDSLGGYYSNPNAVIIGHNCETCRTNYEKMDWEDKYLCPDPFAKDEDGEEQK